MPALGAVDPADLRAQARTSLAAPHGSKRGNWRSLLHGDGASRAEAAPARMIGSSL
jgi:hypothetical protein